MTAQAPRRDTVLPRLLVSVGFIAAAAMSAAPANADPIQDAFLNALDNAGVPYNDPATAVSLGQQICPMLAQPGGNFASVASTMSGHNGLSASMAGLFTSVAISMYCPSTITSLENGDFTNAFPVPGGLIPGGFQIPGL